MNTVPRGNYMNEVTTFSEIYDFIWACSSEATTTDTAREAYPGRSRRVVVDSMRNSLIIYFSRFWFTMYGTFYARVRLTLSGFHSSSDK